MAPGSQLGNAEAASTPRPSTARRASKQQRSRSRFVMAFIRRAASIDERIIAGEPGAPKYAGARSWPGQGPEPPLDRRCSRRRPRRGANGSLLMDAKIPVPVDKQVQGNRWFSKTSNRPGLMRSKEQAPGIAFPRQRRKPAERIGDRARHGIGQCAGNVRPRQQQTCGSWSARPGPRLDAGPGSAVVIESQKESHYPIAGRTCRFIQFEAGSAA